MNQLSKNENIRLIPEFTFQVKGKSVARTTLNKWLAKAKDGYTVLGTTLLLLVFAVSSFQAPQVNPVPAQGSAIVIDSVKTDHNTYVAKTIWKKAEKTTMSAAPVANPDNARDYILHFADIAQKEQAAYGIPASITLGQGLIESNSGKSGIAQSCNNHFGIKCFNKRHRGCCEKWNDDNNNDSFRKFKSPWYSFREHSKLLSNKHYKSLHQYGKDYRKWAYGLKKKGYATDKAYAEKLIGIIERYDLHKYD
jgi:flagellum-specific peptidoglycan hydrolase FlgJ